MYVWTSTVVGPENSPFEGGEFTFDFEIPSDYPSSAPKVLCKTYIYHPNISKGGDVCLDIIKGEWSSDITIL